MCLENRVTLAWQYDVVQHDDGISIKHVSAKQHSVNIFGRCFIVNSDTWKALLSIGALVDMNQQKVTVHNFGDSRVVQPTGDEHIAVALQHVVNEVSVVCLFAGCAIFRRSHICAMHVRDAPSPCRTPAAVRALKTEARIPALLRGREREDIACTAALN